MRLPVCSVGLLLAVTAGAALSAPPAVPPITITPAAPATDTAKPVDPKAMEAGRRLARLINQEQVQVDAAVRLIDTSFIPTIAADPNIKQLEAEYPGLLRRIGDDMKPLMASYTRKVLPDYIERAAAIYAGLFSAAEIDDLYGIYASPAGQRLIASMTNNITADALLQEAVKDPKSGSSLAAVGSDHYKAAAAALKTTSDADKQAFTAIFSKAYFTRMIQLGPKLRKLEQDMINQPDPERDAEIRAVIERAMREHIEAAKAAK
jgi:hypothetical protein